MKASILVIGANGQLGVELTLALQERYGKEAVVATDIRKNNVYEGIFEILDATDRNDLSSIVKKYHITQIYHLAAILSAKGEEKPMVTWDLNMKTWFNVLEVARLHKVEKVFYPSSIAVFGTGASAEQTPNDAFLDPTTVYGISKVAGEHWAQYYYNTFGLDVRSLRFPGIIGYKSMPGGGTTDYAVEIFHKAVLQKEFTCFLKKDSKLPMIFMYDAIRAAIELMDAPREKIGIRTSYNISGVSFSPQEIYKEICKFYPAFKISYRPDHRQAIADSWPNSIDDMPAHDDWGWKPKFNITDITEIMIDKLKEKYGPETKHIKNPLV